MNIPREIFNIYERLGQVVEALNNKPLPEPGGAITDKDKPIVGKDGHYGVELGEYKQGSKGGFYRTGDPSEEFRQEWTADKDRMRKEGWRFMEMGYGHDRSWRALKLGKRKETE